jgi:hypothetical protein
MHRLSPFAPLNVTIDDTAGGSVLLAACEGARTVELTHVSGDPIWYCHPAETPEAGKGFCLLPGTQKVYDRDSLPLDGLVAICAAGESGTASIGLG